MKMSLAKMLAMWAVLASIFLAQGAKSRYEDASTGLLESDWYVAAQDLPMLNDFCENWEGLQHAHVFDLFSHSKRVCQAFQRKGLPGTYLRYSFMPLWGHIVQVWIPSGAAERTWVLRLCLVYFFLLKITLPIVSQSFVHHPLNSFELLHCWQAVRARTPDGGTSMFAVVPISASVHRRKATLSRANNNFMIFYVLSNFGVSAYGSMTSSSFKLYMHGDLPLNQGWATLWEHKQQASENVYPHCPELWNPDQPHFVLATDHPADCWAAKGFYALEAANHRFLDSSVRFELCAHLLGFFGMDILKGSHLLTNMEQPGQSIVCKCL